MVPWVPEVFSRLRRGALSVAGRSRNWKLRMKSLWHPGWDFAWVADHPPLPYVTILP